MGPFLESLLSVLCVLSSSAVFGMDESPSDLPPRAFTLADRSVREALSARSAKAGRGTRIWVLRPIVGSTTCIRGVTRDSSPEGEPGSAPLRQISAVSWGMTDSQGQPLRPLIRRCHSSPGGGRDSEHRGRRVPVETNYCHRHPQGPSVPPEPAGERLAVAYSAPPSLSRCPSGLLSAPPTEASAPTRCWRGETTQLLQRGRPSAPAPLP